MAKGDHVFNNVGSVIRGTLTEGLRCYGDARGWDDLRGVNESQARDWLKNHAPRTSALVEGVFDAEGFGTGGFREGLQTSSFAGGDPNAGAFNQYKNEFRAAVFDFFQELLRMHGQSGDRFVSGFGGPKAPSNAHSTGLVLPNLNRIAEAFGHMARNAVDEGAAERLLDERRGTERRDARVLIERGRHQLAAGAPYMHELFATLCEELTQIVSLGLH